MTETEAQATPRTYLSVRFSEGQASVYDKYRRRMGWTKTRLLETALEEFFTSRGIDWPKSDRRYT